MHGQFHVEAHYADGVRLFMKCGRPGVRFEGTHGWVYVTRGAIDAGPKSLLRERIGPGEIHLYRSDDHKQNLLDCVRSRRDPVANVEIGHRSATLCYLADIAMRAGRTLHWDPERERFLGDDAANRELNRPMAGGWTL